MARHQVGVDSVFVEDLGHRVVEGFERTAAAVQEVVLSGVQFASSPRRTAEGSAG
jgi:hypothetical protein